MKVGLIDVDGHNFPNLALMKISAYHKSRGDQVEFAFPMYRYDKVYVSKVFGDEYTKMPPLYIQADEIVYGGTGFAITVENGKEVYHKCNDKPLPPEIEHIYPDYTLYPNLTKDTAYGFLTRGCPNNCGFCIVSQKECARSVKVADLSEFWRGQRHIKLLDPNLLACKDRADLLRQLIDSRARVDFTQGLDARFVTEEAADMANIERHKQLCAQLTDTYQKKNADYGNSFGDTFADLGIISAITRIADKFNRVKNLAKLPPDRQRVKSESITDTLLDMANYCIMTVIEIENQNKQGGANNE